MMAANRFVDFLDDFLRYVQDEILAEQLDSPKVLDDIMGKKVNQHELERQIERFKPRLINPPRPGKKCLVLDIDYTLIDPCAPVNPHKRMRPYLHEFLTTAYQFYDIIIWSANGMELIEIKMEMLGVLSHPDYKVTAMVGAEATIAVQSKYFGEFRCKPLGVIWGNCPEFYNSKNTIMFDDKKRNFVMNPKNGLVIKPFRMAHVNRETDRELLDLADYLVAISPLEDLSELDHRRWRDYSDQRKKRRLS